MPVRHMHTGAAAVMSAAALCLVITSCGRSTSSTPSGGSTNTASPPSAGSSAQAAGSFGSLTKVCAPGPGTGGSGRGIVGKTIRIGVMADPGAAAAPGLEQEFFDTADAFVKWCNAAGGINGRTDRRRQARRQALQRRRQEVIQACQKDFMLVGGGNALDATRREAAPGLQTRPDSRIHRLARGHIRRSAGNPGGQRPDDLQRRRRSGCSPRPSLTPSMHWASPAAASPRLHLKGCARRRPTRSWATKSRRCSRDRLSWTTTGRGWNS